MNRGAFIVVGMLLLSVGGCATDGGRHSDREVLELRALRGYELQQIRVVVRADLLESKAPVAIRKGDMIGHYAPLPEDRGGMFKVDLEQSEAAYRAGRYAVAASILRPLVANGEDDPFILNAYARALYRVDRKAAYDVYRRLVDGLDRLVAEMHVEHGVKPAIIDAWFDESYWKLGTLHLDRREFREAAYEMCRSLVARGLFMRIPEELRDANERGLAEQHLQYLTEAHAELGELEDARYYARWTLRVNPANTYVYEYVPRGSL